MIYRCILAEWAKSEYPSLPKALEGEFSEQKLKDLNSKYYHVYFFPNYPSTYEPGVPVDGSAIDTFRYVFVDMDLKQKKYDNKQQFIDLVLGSELKPTFIVDSGNGVHAYWQVIDLDAMSYLKLQRRLARDFNTEIQDVCKIAQLMRAPGYANPKHKDAIKDCTIVHEGQDIYSCEQLDSKLAIITQEDEEYCKRHYDKTYSLTDDELKIEDKIPLKFAQLIKNNNEVKEIWSGNLDDRSKGDYRLGHIMFASGFTKEEATSVLINSAKALNRAPKHRISYATNIIDKIWTFELTEDKNSLNLSKSVREILNKAGDSIKGTRFPCWSYIDATQHGFRLGQVIGLVAGSGVGKTAIALNMFLGFVQNNPDYEHFFIPLEQPANEIAERWRLICGEKTHLHDKVHVLSNYNDDGSFRHLSLDEIKDYLLKFQEVTKRKIGCVVIDHIGALKKKSKDGESQGLMDICHSMKAFAIQTNTMMVMQSQAPREKAGIGDLELNKDAAYGTVYFESYCDYLISLWQPLKRCYDEGAPTITAFKFCKIRHKNQKIDRIKEDVCYKVMFDPDTELLRETTQDEDKSFTFFLNQATNKRKQDRKTDIVTYKSTDWTKGDGDGKVNSNNNLN